MSSDVSTHQEGSGQTKQPGFQERRLSRGVVYSLLAALAVYLGFQTRGLWRDWQSFAVERDRAEDSVVVGYPNIFVRPSLARKPDEWLRSEGEVMHLWAGWDEGKGHHWFQMGRGDLDRGRVTEPIGRDVVRAIDDPWIEVGGGEVWNRIPPRASVIGQTLQGLPCAYPILVLQKVLVINDLVNDHPYLLVFSPGGAHPASVSIFDRAPLGEAAHLGTSGYLLEGQPILYDRDTESLWTEKEDSLIAFTGRFKGTTLPLVARPSPVAWRQWKSANPNSRLVIGARNATPRVSAR